MGLVFVRGVIINETKRRRKIVCEICASMIVMKRKSVQIFKCRYYNQRTHCQRTSMICTASVRLTLTSAGCLTSLTVMFFVNRARALALATEEKGKKKVRKIGSFRFLSCTLSFPSFFRRTREANNNCKQPCGLYIFATNIVSSTVLKMKNIRTFPLFHFLLSDICFFLSFH